MPHRFGLAACRIGHSEIAIFGGYTVKQDLFDLDSEQSDSEGELDDRNYSDIHIFNSKNSSIRKAYESK